MASSQKFPLLPSKPSSPTQKSGAWGIGERLNIVGNALRTRPFFGMNPSLSLFRPKERPNRVFVLTFLFFFSGCEGECISQGRTVKKETGDDGPPPSRLPREGGKGDPRPPLEKKKRDLFIVLPGILARLAHTKKNFFPFEVGWHSKKTRMRFL